MKFPISILSCFALLTGWAAADQPKKAPISRYTSLWLNSPFTSKPPPPGPAEVAEVFADYALGGVSPISGGYRVTLLNKKNPEERLTIDTDNPNSKFKILNVTRKPGDPLGTTVRMTNGSQTGNVSYDEKLLTLATAAPKAGAPPVPGQPPQPGQPPVPQPQPQNGQPQRQPRPRVVPPPVPAAGGQQVPQVQQGQPAPQQIQRPERRRN